MQRTLLITLICLLLVVRVQAQTPAPVFTPQAVPATAQLDPLLVVLVTFAGVVLTALGSYIGAWFVRRTNEEKTKSLLKTEADKTKVEIDKKAEAIKQDIEAQNAEDRKELRRLFKAQNDELKQELKDLRESTKAEIEGLRLEVREAKAETKTQTEITSTLQAENAQLRKDVDHMPQEIARLEALLVKKGNGDGQGTSKSVLDAGSAARVEVARDDAPPDGTP